MSRFAEVHREVYIRHTRGGGAPCLGVRYVGQGLWREERLSHETASDWCERHLVRISEDNGRTWSDWQLLHEQWPLKDGFSKEEMPIAWCHDPASGRTVQFIFQRLLVGEGAEAIQAHFSTGRRTCFDHNLWATSDDEGVTFTEAHQLRYEDGPTFNPGNWADREHLKTNQMYGSYGAIATGGGTLIYPAAGVPMEITDSGEKQIVSGVLCFIGKWNADDETYDWDTSSPIYVPRRVSGRGLMEPTIAGLGDGRLLMVMRGSNQVFPPDWQGEVENGGHAWMTLSEDGGYTWSPVSDLRYDSGEPFYSPSAYSVLLRHSRSGKLLWVGNILPHPAEGNRPRYPLLIGQVDEAIPALRKDTLTVIDDRDPESDTTEVQFSNFSVLENRESGEIELYMTRYGERHSHWLHADAYKYTIRLLARNSPVGVRPQGVSHTHSR
jgi:hypothetical protein